MWNPRLTWKFHRKGKVLYKIYGGGFQPVQKEKCTREKIQKETINFIVDFVTSEEQLQSVAHRTLQMKDSDGKKVKIARNIRRVHDAELIRQVQALLQENKLQVPSESTPRHLFHLMPAGNAKEIKGFDPVYENHRRAFASLQELCTEMHKVFISRDDFERVDLMEKVQQGLATSASYLLGHFAYNISPNSKCESHCVNFACSDPKNLNQQENCSAESIDDSEGHSEQCEYCNLFPQAYSLLEKLFEEAKGNFTELEAEEKLDVLEKGRLHVYAYKKQVFRHYVGSKRWNNYFQEKKTNRVHVNMDFAMKWVKKVPRETQPEWFGKDGISWHAVAYERMVEEENGWLLWCDLS